MGQTNQYKPGILLRNSASPFYDSLHAAGNRDGMQLGSGPELHVAKSGNDSTGDGSDDFPFLSINKAMSLLEVGGTITVHANGGIETIYSESTASSAYVPAQTWFDHPVAVGARISGLINNRCTLRAAPGDEGLVTLDGGTTQIGIHANDHNYWNVYGLRIKNCREEGIINNGQVPDHVPNIENLSTGWRIENCLIDSVIGAEGNNVSGIGPWGSRDWHIRNCFIKNISAEGTTVASAIQAYGAINMLVEHVATDNVEFGIFLKDHFLETDSPRTPYTGMEVRYCNLKTLASSINIGIRGAGSCEAGNQYIHHNVMHGYDGTTDEAIQFRMGGAAGQSKKFRFLFNVVDIVSGATNHLVGSAFEEIESYGNIFVGGTISISSLYGDYPEAITRLTNSDYNVYTNFQAILNRYDAASTTFANLAAWQAAVIGSPIHLGLSNPDTNSIIASASTLFTNREINDYTSAVSSPALAMLPDGSNAGAYQHGTETIGLLPTYSAGL